MDFLIVALQYVIHACGILFGAVAMHAAFEVNRLKKEARDAKLDLVALQLKLREFHEVTKKVDCGNLFAGIRNDRGERQHWPHVLARAIVKLTSAYRQ